MNANPRVERRPYGTPEFSLMRARAQDAEALTRVSERTFRATFGPYNSKADMDSYVSETFAPELQKLEILDPKRTIMLAISSDQQIVGFVHLKAHSVPVTELLRLYVTEEAHRSGVGSALMLWVLEHCKNVGCQRIFLGVWDRNFRALAFYHRWNFKEVGETPFKLGRDTQRDLILERETLA